MTHISMVDIGRRIRKIRKSRGMTQHALSLLAEVDRKQISRMENGLSLLQADGLKRIADSLDVTVDYLLTGQRGDDRMDKLLQPFPEDAKRQIVEGLAMILNAIR